MGKGEIRQVWGMGWRSRCSSGPSFTLRVGRAQMAMGTRLPTSMEYR